MATAKASGSDVKMASTMLAVLLAAMIALHSVQAKPFPAPDLRRCAMAFNDTSEDCCTLPGPKGPPKKFSFQPQLPLRVRRAAHLVDDAYIAKYQRAVELMRALPASDGRSFVAQYKLHCAYCNNHLYFEGNEYPLEIHQNWLFFAWHRLYLYFHERILAKLIDDDTFALPFWNWDNQNATLPLPNVIPKVYASNVTLFANPINKTSSLWHPLRGPCSTIPGRIADIQNFQGCLPQDVNATRVQNAQLMYTQSVSMGVTPNTIHGAPYRFGDYGGKGLGSMEGRPHGPIHIWTNVRVMATNKDSASDPIFFGHHANVDRLWEHQKSLPGLYRKDVSDPDYLNTEFTFYDEDGEQVTVSIAQSLDLKLLRYEYEPIPFSWAEQGPGHPSWQTCNPNATAADIASLIARTPRFHGPVVHRTGPTTFRVKRRPRMSASHGEEILEIKAKFDWHKSHLSSLFAYLPDANYESTSIGCAEYLGNIFSFPHVGMSPEVAPELTFTMGIRRKLEVLGREDLDWLVVTMVGSATNPPTNTEAGETGFELTSARIIFSKL